MIDHVPYGNSVDIWSVGILCYELLIGHPPFADSKSKKDLFKSIRYVIYFFIIYIKN